MTLLTILNIFENDIDEVTSHSKSGTALDSNLDSYINFLLTYYVKSTKSNITIPSKIVYIVLTWVTWVPAPVCSKNRRWFLVPPDIPLLLRPSGPNFASLWPLAANLPKLAPNLAEKLGLGPQTTCGCGHTCCTSRNQA